MSRSVFGKNKNRVLVGETYSTNNDALVLASMMAKYKQNGMVGYSDNTGTVKAPRFVGDFSGNATTSTRANTVRYTVTMTGATDITGNPEYLNSLLYLSANSTRTLTIINPVAGNAGLLYNLYNIGSNQINVVSGNFFIGKYGSGTSMLVLPANTFAILNSNGTYWSVIDRSVENQVYGLTTTASTFPSASANYQYAGATLFLTSTFATNGTFTSGVFSYPLSTLTIPSATDANVLNQTYTIYNNSTVNNIRLSSASTFIGQYQNNASPITTSDIGVNSSLIFYSNGTNWVVTSGSSTLSNLQLGTSASFTISRANFRKTNVISAYNNSNLNITIPNPIASDVGLDYYFTRLWSNAAGLVSIVCSTSNPVITTNSGVTPQVSGSAGISTAINVNPRITARQTGYSGTGVATFTTSTSMTVTSITSGFLYYNSIVTVTSTGLTATVGAVSVYSAGPPTTGSNGGAVATDGGIFAVSGYTGSTGVSYDITWGNVYTWVVG